MKLISRLLSFAAPALLVGLLAGCAAGAQQQDTHSHSSTAGGSSAMMDMQSMCEMHKTMMSGKTPSEQQAMMQEHMKSMTPEMRQRMQMMQEQCK